MGRERRTRDQTMAAAREQRQSRLSALRHDRLSHRRDVIPTKPKPKKEQTDGA